MRATDPPTLSKKFLFEVKSSTLLLSQLPYYTVNYEGEYLYFDRLVSNNRIRKGFACRTKPKMEILRAIHDNAKPILYQRHGYSDVHTVPSSSPGIIIICEGKHVRYSTVYSVHIQIAAHKFRFSCAKLHESIQRK